MGDQAYASKGSAGLEAKTSVSKTLLAKTGATADLGQGLAAPSLPTPIPGTSVGPWQRWIRGATGTPRASSPNEPRAALFSVRISSAHKRPEREALAAPAPRCVR